MATKRVYIKDLRDTVEQLNKEYTDGYELRLGAEYEWQNLNLYRNGKFLRKLTQGTKRDVQAKLNEIKYSEPKDMY